VQLVLGFLDEHSATPLNLASVSSGTERRVDGWTG